MSDLLDYVIYPALVMLLLVGIGFAWGQVRLIDYWIRRYQPRMAAHIVNLDAREQALREKERDLERRGLNICVYEMAAERAIAGQRELQAQLDSITSEPDRKRLRWLLQQTAAYLGPESDVVSFSQGRDRAAVDAQMGEK